MPPASSHKGVANAKNKQSKIVVFKISSDRLEKWPSDSLPRSKLPSATPVKEDSPKSSVAADFKKEDTPQQNGSTLEVPQRKKPGPPKGTKRKAEALLPDGTPKPRGKPGPKKRKLDGDDTSRPWTTPANTTAGHKLGPKANQGAINAGLRALDRSGKPCRKWSKKTFSIKSFTGQSWTLASWGAPQRAEMKSDGENKENVATSNSEAQSATPAGNRADSSDAGQSGATPAEGSAAPAASSPPPVATPVEAAA